MPRLPTAARLLVGALLTLVLLAPLAQAQVPAPRIDVTLDQDTLRLGANGTATVTATLRYTDDVPNAQGTVTLTVDAPEGWVVVIQPAPTFPMNAGSTQTVTLDVTAPPGTDGRDGGDALLTATMTAGAGRPTGTATATLALERAPLAPLPPADAWPVLLAAALVLVALGLVTFAFLRQARGRAADRAAILARETGITLAQASDPMPFGDRREVALRVAVRNRSMTPRVALLLVRDITPGWCAAVNLPRKELAPGETFTATLTVRPPDSAPLGAAATVVLAARPEEALERDERLTLQVQAPDAHPATNGARLFRTTREGVVPKLLRP